ncbi:hypothetical protein B0H14DRAFT_2719972 [Mycena olivaceomarginata]|nr:hypothetical protein B0H14DRAFT_2719972 [Mycena olivaceomarginata]
MYWKKVERLPEFERALNWGARRTIIDAIQHLVPEIFEQAIARSNDLSTKDPSTWMAPAELATFTVAATVDRHQAPDLGLTRIATSIRLLQQARGAEAKVNEIRNKIPGHWLSQSSASVPGSKGQLEKLYEDVSQGLMEHIDPAIRALCGGEMLSVNLEETPVVVPGKDVLKSPKYFYVVHRRNIKPEKELGVPLSETEGVGEILERVAQRLRTSKMQAEPLRRWLETQEMEDQTYSRFTQPLRRVANIFAKFRDLIVYPPYAALFGEKRGEVVAVFTTAIVVTAHVQDSVAIWLWADHRLERLLQEQVETSGFHLLRAELYEEAAVMLEACLLYTVLGSARNWPDKTRDIGKWINFQLDHQALKCGLHCGGMMEGDGDEYKGRSKRSAIGLSTCQYRARRGNRNLTDPLGWSQTSFEWFPCLSLLFRASGFCPGIAAHGLISSFQAHFHDKCARGKETHWRAVGPAKGSTGV